MASTTHIPKMDYKLAAKVVVVKLRVQENERADLKAVGRLQRVLTESHSKKSN